MRLWENHGIVYWRKPWKGDSSSFDCFPRGPNIAIIVCRVWQKELVWLVKFWLGQLLHIQVNIRPTLSKPIKVWLLDLVLADYVVYRLSGYPSPVYTHVRSIIGEGEYFWSKTRLSLQGLISSSRPIFWIFIAFQVRWLLSLLGKRLGSCDIDSWIFCPSASSSIKSSLSKLWCTLWWYFDKMRSQSGAKIASCGG